MSKVRNLLFCLPALGLTVCLSEIFGQPACVNGPANIKTARDLPGWPGSREASLKAASKEYLFFDAPRGEVVVYFPEILSDPSADPVKWVEFRWEPQFLVAPVVKAEFKLAEENWYEYKYSVDNVAGAKREIRWFTLVANAKDDSIVTSHPTWFAFGAKPIPPAVAPQAAIMDAKVLRDPANLGHFIGWKPMGSNQGIQPAERVSGLLVRSRFLPGIITAYANSGNALRVGVAIPPEIHDQIVTFLAPERNYKAVATIGPKFPANAEPASVARDFQNVLEFLTKQGCLLTDSPLMREMKDVLDKSVKANARVAFVLRGRPSNDFEAEIAQALTASLSLRP